MRAIAYLVGWLLFMLAGTVTVVVCFFAILIRSESRFVENALRAMDRLAAVFCGCSGRYTISAECAVREERFFRVLRRFLDGREHNHCYHAALHEGLVPIYTPEPE